MNVFSKLMANGSRGNDGYKIKNKFKIVIVGGGTGGHIMPALAVADSLREAEHEVHFLGSLHGLEATLVKAQGYPFHGISAGKLRRYADWRNLLDILKIKIGFFQSWRILSLLHPDVIFTKGGYVALPVVYAASLLHIPVVAHESDAKMGLANRLTARAASIICTGFPAENYPLKLQSKIRFTGNPVRAIFRSTLLSLSLLRKKYKFASGKPIVLFLGGSQGAHVLNRLVIKGLANSLRQWQIIHITGSTDFAWACAAAEDLSQVLEKDYHHYSFVDTELPDFMALADFVVTRSSANIVAELAALRKPVALIPLPSAANDHQRANAAILRRHKAALVWEESELNPAVLISRVNKILAAPLKRHSLACALSEFDRQNAVAEIVTAIEGAAGQRSKI